MIAHTFFEAYGWTPEVLVERTMRELVAYSKCIKLSKEESARFQAALVDKRIEIPGHQQSNQDAATVDRIRQLEQRLAQKHGFKQ